MGWRHAPWRHPATWFWAAFAVGVCTTHLAAAAGEEPIDVIESEVSDDTDSVTIVNQSGADLSVVGGVSGVGPFVEADPSPVGPGEQATIEVDRGDQGVAAAANFLIIVAPTDGLPAGWSTSIPFTLDDEGDVAEPAVTKWRIVDYTGTGFAFEEGSRGRDVPLENDGDCSALTLGEWDIVGRVQGEGRSAPVVARCVERDGELEAEMRVNGLSSNGIDYTGTIDFDPSDDESPTFELTVRRTLKPSLFLGLLLVGVAFAYVARWWTGSGKAVAEQKLRLASIREQITSTKADNPLTKFATIVAAGGLTVVSRWTLLDDLHKTLEEQQRELDRAGRLWRPAGKVTSRYKNADSALTKLEGVLAKWPDLANLLVRLRGLIGRLDALPALRNDVLKSTIGRDSHTIAVTDVDGIRSKAQLGVDVAIGWPAERAKRVADRYRELDQLRFDDDVSFTEAQTAARRAWTGYQGRACDAKSVEAVNEATSLLYDAESAIEAALALSLDAEYAPGAHPESVDGGPEGIHRDAEVNATALNWSRKLRVTQWLVDSLLVGAVVLVALIAGLQALYIDKAVGGWWDCLVTVTWGFATVTVAEPIAAAIQRVADGLTRDSTPPPASS